MSPPGRIYRFGSKVEVHDVDGNGQFNAGDRVFYEGQRVEKDNPKLQTYLFTYRAIDRANKGQCKGAVSDFLDAKKLAARAGIRFNGAEAVRILRQKMCLK